MVFFGLRTSATFSKYFWCFLRVLFCLGTTLKVDGIALRIILITSRNLCWLEHCITSSGDRLRRHDNLARVVVYCSRAEGRPLFFPFVPPSQNGEFLVSALLPPSAKQLLHRRRPLHANMNETITYEKRSASMPDQNTAFLRKRFILGQNMLRCIPGEGEDSLPWPPF